MRKGGMDMEVLTAIEKAIYITAALLTIAVCIKQLRS